MHRFTDRLTQVQHAINEGAALSNRNAAEITLLAVSKKHSAEKIRTAAELGLTQFGENYLQEALDKQAELADLNLIWHFIGPIQSNKTRAIAEHFDWVHSVDRLKIAQRLSAQRPETAKPLNVCLQINIDNEETKSGIMASDTIELARQVIALPRLNLRGLMIIPSANNSEEQQRDAFRRTRILKQTVNAELASQLDTLSMGMSADLNLAIAEGATIVRIGTALFGQRPTT